MLLLIVLALSLCDKVWSQTTSIKTNTGIDYVVPTDLLTILNNGAILTAFYGRISRSTVTQVRVSATGLLPSGFAVDSTSPTVELGSWLSATPAPRDVLVSSFIPFTWEEMNDFFMQIALVDDNIAAIRDGYQTLRPTVCGPVCRKPPSAQDNQWQTLCGCFRISKTVVAASQFVVTGVGLDPASCAPKSACAQELQQIIFDAINTLVVQEILGICSSACPGYPRYSSQCGYSVHGSVTSCFKQWGVVGAQRRAEQAQAVAAQQEEGERSLGSTSVAAARARQQAWAQDQLNKNTKNRKVVKKRGALRSLLVTATTSSSGGVSIAFRSQINAKLLSLATYGLLPPTTDNAVVLFSNVFAKLKSQIQRSAMKLMTAGYLDHNLAWAYAGSDFVCALWAGTVQAGGTSSNTFTVISADMSDVNPNAVKPSGNDDNDPAPFLNRPKIFPPTSAPTPSPVPAPRSQAAVEAQCRSRLQALQRGATQRPTRKPTRRPTPEPTESEYTDDEPPPSYTDDAQAV